ncbi:carbon-phosphorus lyase complex subunit PhnI [Clostridium bowmanii]|uniref:carbon-phosphorus lyase complex subunit PhnI n=1 Tax=Clostridium bowmanii TaxID=132925 RepID=UPI001C0C281D|nr:carbon-phosphorus lyase complex subunit PhnI [Clostridium bowmanii]MBU3189663.1 carbon-phosphorus lyase complex subunit PhnI [Clostridium bowmanii]MCA1073492.1 carbon-phosphorus lyase complex subunit PhnI [Clostridium bowmanii]
MGYIAVKGGSIAIEESIRRLKYERLKEKTVLKIEDINGGLRGLIDQVMSESSIYSKELASIAIKQSEGNLEEAVFLLRAYRSTLPRKHYTRIVDSSVMFTERRISASFKDVPGGQILGSTYDYTHRLIDFDLVDETSEDGINWVNDFEKPVAHSSDEADLSHLPKVLEYLRKEGLIEDFSNNDEIPIDITKKSIEFPTTRSERLQILTRGQTGTVTSLGYAALRAYGALHPTVGELRVGMIPLYIDNPLKDSRDDKDEYYIGEIKITEVETFIPRTIEKKVGIKEIRFDIGYGICYGQNETKAIAMSILEQCLEAKDKKYPTQDEEFVLLHIDSVESSGFISHLKLPHYVTFQSKLDSMRKIRTGGAENENKV